MNYIVQVKKLDFAIRVSLIYLLVSLLWIIFSDQIANTIFQDTKSLSFVQTMKGFAFVAVNAVALYVVIRNYVNRIQRTETTYQLLFQSNPHPMWTYDPKTLAFLSVNDAAVRQYGYSHEEFLNMTIKDIRPPEEIPALLEDIASGIDEPKVWTHRKKNDKLMDVEIRTTTIPQDNTEIRLILSQDVTETQEIKRKLIEAEEQYRTLVNTSPDAIFVYTEKAVRFANPAGMKMFGVTEEEMGNVHLTDIEERTESAIVDLMRRAIETDETYVGLEYRLRLKNGQVYDIELSDAPIIFDGEKARLTIVRDIARRKQSEADLRESEERFRSLVEANIAGTYILVDGLVRYANPALLKMFGHTADEVIDKMSPIDFVHPDDLERVMDVLKRRLEGTESQNNYIFKGVHKNGNVVYVEVFGNTTNYHGKPALIGTMVDITERRKAEIELFESEERFRILSEANIAGTYIVQDNVVQYANPAILKIFDYQPEDVIGKFGPINFVHTSDRDRVIQIMQGRLDGIEDKSHYTFKGVDKSGEIKEIEVFGGSALFNGRPALIGTMIDITQRRKTERELEQSEANLRAIFDNALQAFFLFDSEKRIKAVNKVAEQWVAAIVGEQDMVGELANDLWDNLDLSMFDEAFMQALNGQSFSFEQSFALDSHSRWFEVYANPVMEGDIVTGVALSVLDNTERKNRERIQEILARANATIVETLNLDTVFENLLSFANDLVAFDSASVLLLTDTGNELELQVGRLQDRTYLAIGRMFLIEDFPDIQEILSTQESKVIDDTSAFLHWNKPEFSHFRSWLGIPLIAGGEVLGIYSIESKTPKFFTDQHVSLLQSLAAHSAVAVKNAQLYAETENYAHSLARRVAERTAELQTQYKRRDGLATIELAINEEHELQLMMHKTVDVLRDLLDASMGCSVVLWDKESEKFDISATNVPLQPLGITAVRVRRQGGASRWIVENHRPLIVSDTKNDPFGANKLITEYGVRAYAGVPLNFNNITSGVLYVLDDHPRDYSVDEIELLQQFADRVAVAINRVQLYKQLQETNQNLQESSDALAVRIERTSKIVNSNSNGIILLSIENGIQEVNLAFQTMVRSSQASCIGRSLSDFVCPEDQDIMENAIKNAQDKTIQNIEMCMKRLDSTTFSAELAFAPVVQLTSENIQLVCTIQDISERKRVEKELRQRDNWYRTLASHLPNTTVMLFDQDYRYLIIENSEPYFTKQEAEGKTVQELLPPDSFEELFPIYEATLRGEYNQVERHKHDKIFMGEYVPIPDDEGNITAGLLFSRDITDQRQQERILQENEERLRILFDSLPDGIILSTVDGILYDLNPALLNMVGLPREQLVGRSLFEVLPQMGMDVAILGDMQSLPTDTGKNSEHVVQLANGQTLWLQFITHQITIQDEPYLLSMVRNITKRKEMEIALRENEEKYRALVDLAPNPIVMVDNLGIITLVNKAVTESFDYGIHELIGKPIETLIPHDRRDIHTTMRADYVSNPTARSMATGLNIVLLHNNGNEIPVEIGLRPILINGEQHTLAHIIDITTHWQLEESLRDALTKERELNEMKSRFVSSVSHEFRTPLASILALSETLSAYRDKLTDEQIEKRLDKVRDHINHLTEIMDDVLQLAQIQEGGVTLKPVRLNFDELCRNVIDEFELLLDDNHQIMYTFDGEKSEIELDGKLMRQIITNLLSNAIKYSPEKGIIKVDIKQSEDNLRLSVSDEGIGIPLEDTEHLFEPFHRATNVGTIAGTGLGLFITKEAVELHGGTIRISDQVESGATFIIEIPIINFGVNSDDENISN